jgi:hypothetical protein
MNWGAEGDDFAAAYLGVGQNATPDTSGSEGGTVHEQEIANQQGVLHTFRGDDHGLREEGENEKRSDDGAEERGDGFGQAVLTVVVGYGAASGWARAGRERARRDLLDQGLERRRSEDREAGFGGSRWAHALAASR